MENDPVFPTPFKLARYLVQYEFKVKHMLSCSDAESMPMGDLVGMADEECKELWENLYLGYTESQGLPLLRKEVAKLHPNISPDEVLVAASQEGIYIALKSLVSVCHKKTGGNKVHAIVTYPGYQSLYEILHSSGCDVSYWKISHGEKGWFFDLDELKSLLLPNTKVIVVNFPHNPTGYVPSLKDWEEIVQICKEYDLYLFSDEMYHIANSDDVIRSACSVYDKGITVYGLSKTFGLPGLRIGWICTQNTTLMKKMAELKDYITICSSAPSEILAVIALRNIDTLVQRVISLLKYNQKAAGEFFANYPDLFEWKPPRASTTGFFKLKPPALSLGEGGATGFCNVLRTEAHILAIPGAIYSFPDEYIRIGLGRANLPTVLALLGNFLDSHFRL